MFFPMLVAEWYDSSRWTQIRQDCHDLKDEELNEKYI